MDKLKKLVKLFRQSEDHFFTAIASECLDFKKSAKAFITNVPIGDLNPIIFQNVSNIDQILAQGKSFFKKANVPFVAIIPEKYCSPEVINILEQRNFKLTDQSVAMFTTIEEQHPSQDSLTQSEVFIQLDTNLNDWVRPLIGAFNSSIEVGASYSKIHQKALDKGIKVQHFCLYYKQQPVSSLTLSSHNNLARIDDVGTLPSFQRKGYATQLLKYALSIALESGATYCFLEASNSGLSIYEQHGFKQLFRNNIYSPSKHDQV